MHADLLSYLADNRHHTIFDKASRASIDELIEGHVGIQVLPIYVATAPGSARIGSKQAKIYASLAQQYPEHFTPFSSRKKAHVRTFLAIENASSFWEEGEPLEKGFRRFQKLSAIEKPLSITLTWHFENRFGGGDLTKIGLKDDGKELLRRLAGMCYAIDLSHTSDALASDILNFIDEEKLPYMVCATHSNFRAIRDVPRNLPLELAQEIVKRGGIIALNVIADFVGTSIDDFLRHVEYALENGFENNIGFGCDFFCEKKLLERFPEHPPLFFPNFENASCYGRLAHLLETHISPLIVDKMAFQNFLHFVAK